MTPVEQADNHRRSVLNKLQRDAMIKMDAAIQNAIACTPTGEIRDELTSINIQYLELKEKWYESLTS